MHETSTDKDLIIRYLKGDSKSFDFLVARYLKIIYNFVYKNVGGSADAEDITQEVFVKVWKNIKKFDRSKNFKPWIFQIARNTFIDFLRKKKSIPFSKFENEKGKNVLIENVATPSVNLIGELSDKKTLATAIKNLTEKEQKIMNLRYGGLSFKEIAAVLNESINTVKSRYRRGIINLRKNIRTQ